VDMFDFDVDPPIFKSIMFCAFCNVRRLSEKFPEIRVVGDMWIPDYYVAYFDDTGKLTHIYLES
jgi:hypothetical protein